MFARTKEHGHPGSHSTERMGHTHGHASDPMPYIAPAPVRHAPQVSVSNGLFTSHRTHYHNPNASMTETVLGAAAAGGLAASLATRNNTRSSSCSTAGMLFIAGTVALFLGVAIPSAALLLLALIGHMAAIVAGIIECTTPTSNEAQRNAM